MPLPTAHNIKHSYPHTIALDEIILAQIKAGQLDDAIASAYQIEFVPACGTRFRALTKIAVAQAKTGQTEQARRTFDEAMKEAHQCHADLANRDDADDAAFSEIVFLKTELGLLGDPAALLHQAKTGAGRARLLCVAARDQVKKGQSVRAREVFREAAACLVVKLSDDVRWDEILRVRELSSIALAQAEAKMTGDAAQTFHQAMVLTAKLKENPIWRTFVEIARFQVAAGLTKDAAGTFREALQAATRLNRDERTKAAFSIAAIETEAGLHHEALAVVREIDDPGAADVVTGMETILQSKMGHFAEAIAKARRVGCFDHRTSLLYRIAADEIEAGKAEQARPLVDEARAADRTAPGCTAGDRCRNWCEVADEGCMPRGDIEVAEAQTKTGHFDDAVATARAVRYLPGRGKILMDIAKAQLEAKRADQALATVAEVIAVAHQIETDVDDKESLLSEAAAIEAKAGRPDQAHREFAEALAGAAKIRPGEDSAATKCLSSVVEAEIKARFFAEAIEACREIEDADMARTSCVRSPMPRMGRGRRVRPRRRRAKRRQSSNRVSRTTLSRGFASSSRAGDSAKRSPKPGKQTIPINYLSCLGLRRDNAMRNKRRTREKRSPSCRPSCVRSGTWRKRTGGFAASVASTTNWE